FYDRLRAVGILLTCILAFAITDASAHQVLKSSIQRHRPSFTLPNVQLRTNAHAGYSFPSNHAANMFAVATVLGFFSSYWLPLFFFIAGIIAYSRVYVGVHFPLDVVVGAIYGILMANIAIWIALKTLSIYRKHKGLPNPPLKR